MYLAASGYASASSPGMHAKSTRTAAILTYATDIRTICAMVRPDAMVKPDALSGASFFAAEYVTQRATSVSIENILMLNPLKTEQTVPTEYSMAAIRARGDAIIFLMAA